MNAQPVTYEFNKNPVPMHPQDGDLWVSNEHIGVCLEYSEPRMAMSKVYSRNLEELKEHSLLVKMTTHDQDGTARRRSVRCFNEEGIMLICMITHQPLAREFRRWAVKILKAYRHGELVLNQPAQRDHLLELCIVEAGKCNVAAIDTLVQRYGYDEGIKEHQINVLCVRYGHKRPSALQHMPLLVSWFISTFLLELKEELHSGKHARCYKSVAESAMKVHLEADGTRTIEHTTSQLLGAVSDVALQDGIDVNITAKTFGESVARAQSDIAAAGWTRKPSKIKHSLRTYKLTLQARAV